MLVEINWNPDRRQLRTFGLSLLAALPVVGTLLSWLVFDSFRPLWICTSVGVGVSAATLFVPPLGFLLYKAWMGFGFCVGSVVSPIFVGVIFYGVLTPVGLALRLLGKDAMQRRRPPEGETCWRPIAHRTDTRSYERQF